MEAAGHNAAMTVALLLASAAMTSTTLTPRTELTKPGAPLVARLTGVEGPCKLLLLDADAKELARASASAGDIDLAALFPTLRASTGVLRVQAVVGGSPDGAPLVVIPLKNRESIRTTTDLRPDGKTSYMRVIGWGDELLEPNNEAYQKLKASWPKPDPQPASGFRLMCDEDVVFETTAGRIRFAMRPDQAPNTVRNFIELAEKGLFDCTIVHRIVPADRNVNPFVIQGGDPTGTGDGGPGYDIPLEPSKLPHDFGVLSMARNDWPDSAGSQWFVCLSREATARLDGQYCAFGYAVEGADTIMKIAAGEIADAAIGRPKSPETVLRAFTLPAPAWIPDSGATKNASSKHGRPDKRVERPVAPAAPAENDR